jgi:hypothetical protein
MIPSLTELKYVGVLAVLAACFFGGYVVRGKFDDAARLKEQAAAQSAQNKLVQDWAANMTAATTRMTTAETQHDKDQRTIDNLRADAGRVRIHIPVCQPARTAADAKTSADTDGRAGAFSAGMDAAFSRLQEGVGRLAYDCDKLNIDARRLNSAIGQ